MTQEPHPVSQTDLIVCPQCDAVYELIEPAYGAKTVCARCHTVLITPRRNAGLQIIAVSVASVVLIVAATVLPFLTIQTFAAKNSVSLLGAALAFSDGPLIVLSLATAALIVFIPLTRMLLSVYVLLPLVFDKPPAPGAKTAFRLAETLRPWSMAEIFVIGCAVALVKIVDLADVVFGPAFWMFGALVVLIVVKDRLMCRWSVWKALDT